MIVWKHGFQLPYSPTNTSNMLYASLHRFSCQLVLTLLTIFEAAVPLLPAHSFAWNRAPPLLQWRPLIQRKQKDSNSTEPNSVKPTGPTLLNPSCFLAARASILARRAFCDHLNGIPCVSWCLSLIRGTKFPPLITLNNPLHSHQTISCWVSLGTIEDAWFECAWSLGQTLQK